MLDIDFFFFFWMWERLIDDALFIVRCLGTKTRKGGWTFCSSTKKAINNNKRNTDNFGDTDWQKTDFEGSSINNKIEKTWWRSTFNILLWDFSKCVLFFCFLGWMLNSGGIWTTHISSWNKRSKKQTKREKKQQIRIFFFWLSFWESSTCRVISLAFFVKIVFWISVLSDLRPGVFVAKPKFENWKYTIKKHAFPIKKK